MKLKHSIFVNGTMMAESVIEPPLTESSAHIAELFRLDDEMEILTITRRGNLSGPENKFTSVFERME